MMNTEFDTTRRKSDPQLFLSHAGEDADISNRLASDLTKVMREVSRSVSVFNTSDSAHRFHDFIDTVRIGERWDSQNEEWEEELRAYLRSNIQNSAAYLLLVTPTSLAKNSQWIQFEIETAAELQHSDDILYIPCACGPGCLSCLPEPASIFQGFDVSTKSGFAMLCDVLNQHLP